jgi:hypothetical protein
MFTKEQVRAGQAVYNRPVLSLYDMVVLGISNRWIWKFPTAIQLAHYNRHVSGRHMDIGVGTGFYLDRFRFPVDRPRVALMDINPRSLEHAARRTVRLRPVTFVRNVLEPISGVEEQFDSVGLNYLLHCLPGSLAEKAVVFDHVVPLLSPGAAVFGATLLQGPDVRRGPAARNLMAICNRTGIFTNERDTLPALREALESRFSDVHIEVQGCGALFSAKTAG